MIADFAQRAGYTIIPNWQVATHSQTRYLRRLFDRLQVDLVLDVGANVGQFAGMIRHEVGYAGDLLSFEPVPDIAAGLARRAQADPRWEVRGCALGAVAGVLPFNVMAESQFSSFLSPSIEGRTMFSESNVIRTTIEVEVSTLDAVFAVRRPSGGTYLKIDTQGYDMSVLQGAAQSLDKVSALQFEASVMPIYDGMPHYQALVDYLQERGFVMSGMFPNNEHQFPAMVEFDCHMVHRSAIGLAQLGRDASAGA